MPLVLHAQAHTPCAVCSRAVCAVRHGTGAGLLRALRRSPPLAAAAFALAFLGYEAQTGLNPTQNVADIVKIWCVLAAGSSYVQRAGGMPPAVVGLVLAPELS